MDTHERRRVSRSAPFERLCALAGVEAAYQDVSGTRHVVPQPTRQRLLAAMGLGGEPTAALARLEAAAWRRCLPPVHVLQEGEACELPVHLPAGQARRDATWYLDLEDGRRIEGVLDTDTPVESVRIGGAGFARFRLAIAQALPCGYHRLSLRRADTGTPGVTTQLIVAPPACHLPEALKGQNRVWGPSVQLYGLRSRRNWGMGDFGDLRRLVELAAAEQADIVGVSPLHALFADDAARASPYSPSSRALLNTLHLDVEAVPELAHCEAARTRLNAPAFRAEIARAREAALVDYPRVAQLKHEILRLLWGHFAAGDLAAGTARGLDYRRFVADGGERLRRHALHEALREHLRGERPWPPGWPAWPEAYRDPAGRAVADFAEHHAHDIGYHLYLQWLATQQLGEVGQRSWQLNLGVGLYLDLAVGVADDGSEAWSAPQHYAHGVRLGAPPDDFSPNGQEWGLLPFSPLALREAAYEPFVACLRTAMREAGALRIDHVMGLARQFWVPAGESAAAGGYVRFPLDDLLGIVALESRRNRCAVIGEDLGTVPKGLRPQLARRGLLSYRPLWFQRRRDGGFSPPAQYPREALVAASTHDLPTLAGFWRGHDLDTRAALGLFPDDEMRERQHVERAQDRARLLLALRREGLLPPGTGLHPVSVPELTTELAAAIHTYLARSPARIMLVQPEDALGIEEQANLPGTVSEHPNWRRKLPLELESWRGEPHLQAVFDALRQARPRAGRATAASPEAPQAAPRIPRATYRLQLNARFDFAQAARIVPYLAELGVSHCYCSPFLRARPGSSHGYDVTDHNAINPEIGSADDLEAFATTARAHGLALVLDVVPNHMGVMGADNGWWLDVLENGEASRYAGYFDIDWQPAKEVLRGKVLLPILGNHYGEVLARGEIRLMFDAAQGEFSLYYWQHRLPLDPAEYPRVLAPESAEVTLPVEFASLVTAFGHLPSRRDTEAQRVLERGRDAAIHKARLARMAARNAAIAGHIDARLAYLNGVPGDAASFDALHEIIMAQAYRLAFWRVAADDINYRRFFDINDLAALRMENEEVFAATHGRILELVARGHAEGLRIDHPDGLYDPGAYFVRLQAAAARARGIAPETPLAIYLTIEKILAEHEPLPEGWPVHGTTGYRYANVANGLFIDTANARKLDRIYAEFVGATTDFDETVYRAKRLIMKTALASELAVLATELARIAALSRYTCDYTANALRDALREVTACFPVYRTYVTADGPAAGDRRHIEWAVARAKKRSQAADISVFDFLRDVLTADIAAGRPADYVQRVLRFARRFQQFTAPVMAKGMEDTAFYRYHRLVATNEVGGDPRTFGFTPAAFHAANRDRARRWPHTMLASSTHDTKRSEDVRARLAVLSEIPAAWKLAVRRWSRLNRSRKTALDGAPAPDRNDEYLLYQTLVGTWPLAAPDDEAGLAAYAERIERYMLKAVREAKERSSWINPNAAYEQALTAFIRALLAPGPRNLFLADFVAALRRVARIGLWNSLAQVLIKFTAPGVPDLYQGNELWQFRLVDPDNREAVDYESLRGLLAGLRRRAEAGTVDRCALAAELLRDADDGRIKLYLTWCALRLRAHRDALFAEGEYLPLEAQGGHAASACAFARQRAGEFCVTAFGRLYARFEGDGPAAPLGEVWQDTRIELPPGPAAWHDALTGRVLVPAREGAHARIAAADLFAVLPWALLTEGPP